MNAQSGPKPAHFAAGKETLVISESVGPVGAVLQTGTTGSPIDNLIVEIPRNALAREVKVSLSYNSGQLRLNSGVASDVFLRVAAENLKRFEQPITIRVKYNAAKWKGHTLVGYAIDEHGRLSSVSGGAKDSDRGEAAFTSLVPILFTFVYTPHAPAQ